MMKWICNDKEIDAIVKRREFLCANVPVCSNCLEQRQIQLVNWTNEIAEWKCRMCGYKFNYEPLVEK